MSDASLIEDLSWWDRACLYRLRIGEEAFRFNTISPPPPKHIRDHTTELERSLGPSFVSTAVIMFVPKWLARRRWP